MSRAEEFYPKLHAKDSGYSGAEYQMEPLLKLDVVRVWAETFNGRQVRMLDVGCGKGVFLRDFGSGLKQRYGIKSVQAAGIDVVRSPNDCFSEVCSDYKFVQQDLDGQPLPFADKSFDFLGCNHVLEHIFETETLLREFHRVLDPQGLCVISVPNIAAWVNRILFLFAGQPLGSELGTEKVTYGFWPTSQQGKLGRFSPSGHIRDFTPRGLHDLTTHCGFETVGWWKQSREPIARLGKWAGRGMGIVLKPSP
jgi:SAM-dependent methyltransferase